MREELSLGLGNRRVIGRAVAVMAIAFVACLSAFAQNVPLFVQGNTTGAAGTSTTIAYSSNVTKGDGLYIVAYDGHESGDTITFTDSQGNSWTTTASANLSTDGDTVAVGCAVAGSTGANTVTFKVNGTTTATRGSIYEFAGAGCTTDGSPVSLNTTPVNSCSSGSLTTTLNNDLLIGFCGTAGPTDSVFGGGVGWSQVSGSGIEDSYDAMGETQIASSIGSYTATSASFPPGNEQTTIEVAYKATTSSYCGETGQSGTDSGNALFGWGTPCVTGTNAGGYSVSSISYWVGSPTSTSFDLGVYGNSSGNPGSLLCSVSTGTITPSSGWNTKAITGCPTLGQNTTYWVGYITGSNSIQQGTVSSACPGTSSLYSAYTNSEQSSAALPASFGSNTPTTGACYSMFMTLNTASLPTPTLTVASSLAPSNYGQSVTFTATISNSLSGTITFYDGATTLGTGTISGSTATYATSALTAGTHSITAAWAGNSSYNAITSQAVGQIVGQITPLIVWSAPSPIANGVALSSTQLDATANVPGTFTYSPAAGTVLHPGVTTLSTTFVPTDAVDYATVISTTAIAVSLVPSSGVIITVAGNGLFGYSGDGGPAILAELSDPTGAAVDSAGNLYFADPGNSVIRKVNASTGIVTTIAGTGTAGYSGDGGPAVSAELLSPMGITLDNAGNIYFADNGNAVVRKINASTGVITTVAGNGSWGYFGDGGPATSAMLSYDTNVAVDSAGNVYIADKYNMRVRKVSAATGIITTIAGNGTAGYSGDGGLATSAELDWPFGVAVDPVGNVYIADLYNNVIRKVTASSGVITTVIGNGTEGYSGDGGAASSAELNGPYDVALDVAGNFYISDSNNNVIRKVAATSGSISTVAGNGTGGYSGDGGPATSAEINAPWDITTDLNGNLYIADSWNHVIRAVGSSVTEPVKAGPALSWADPAAIFYGTALSGAQLNATASVPGSFSYSPALGTVLPAGLQALSVLFTPSDTTHYAPVMSTVPLTVSMVTPTITWPTPAPMVYGAALTSTQLNATSSVPGTFVYTPSAGTIPTPGVQTLTATFTPTDTADYTSVVTAVTLNVSAEPGAGIITTVAGNGINGYTGDDGLAISAEVSTPGGVAFDTAGNLYIASYGGNVIRKVDATTGIITRVAGTGVAGYSGDGASALSAKLNGPCGLAIDAAGNIYIADTNNYRVRKVTVSTGVITTIAGTGVFGYTGDGSAATSAEITLIQGLTLDSAGNIYLPDMDAMVVRKVSATTGTITTIAGTGTQGYFGDGGAATSAKLNQPIAVAFDAAGDLFIADGGNNVVRKVSASTGNISTVAGNGTAGYSGDGGAATSAKLNLPLGGLVVDAANDLLIADSNNNVIRFVNASTGVITTIAGNGTAGYAGDGGPATSAELSGPTWVALDALGNFYVADIYNNRVREVGGQATSSIAVTVSPSTATLYATQQQLFSATVTNTTNTVVTWSITPSGSGTVSSSGLYTAPATIASPRTVTVTATSQANTAAFGSATVSLIPTVAVSINPTNVSLYAGGTQAFSATVSNATNTGVTWSISPTGVGAVDSSGNYTAPSSVSAQQVVTVTATSVADTTKSASAIVNLLPACALNGYGYVRPILIDHTKVQNTDQTSFPVLFSGTYSYLATTSNGGNVQNSGGYDIIFSLDPAGVTKLDFEIETYNPTTGQITAWIRIPTLSHTSDTALYLLYGNTGITSSQANPTGVWSNEYSRVWHLVSGNTSSSPDSTGNQNGTNSGTTVAIGPIGGAATGFNGSTSVVSVPAGGGLAGSAEGTISMWVQWQGHSQQNSGAGDNGAIIGRQSDSVFSNDILSLNGVDPSTATLQWSSTTYSPTLIGATPVGNAWNLVEFAFGPSGQTLYLNGNVEATTTSMIALTGHTEIPLTLGAWSENSYLNGAMEEVRISATPRSADWIATEYNNQNSPSTFYTIKPVIDVAVTPMAVSLYSSQTQQFGAENLQQGTCSLAAVTWSMPSGSPGSLSSDGLYRAPANIAAVQSVSITATSQIDSTQTSAATVTLLPSSDHPTLNLVTAQQPPYSVGTSQGFSATLTDQTGAVVSGATVTFTVVGANGTTGTATTDTNGVAIFAYVGAQPGNDTISATAPLSGSVVYSSALSVSWSAPVQAGDGSVTLLAQPAIALEGLLGAFTDANGSVIEPLAIGASPRVFIVPPGASQLQLGIDDDYYSDNWGPGFTVNVNDVSVNVPPGALPWRWTTGGLNSAYAYGVEDGTNPVIAATSLVAGQTVVVAYQSGLNSPGGLLGDNYDANGVPGSITGTYGGSTGTFAPTYFMSSASYPVGQPAPISALVSDSTGSPLANTPVILIVTGPNSRELSTTSNSNGVASFTYSALNAGTDTLRAEAILAGQTTVTSSQTTITWTTPTTLPTGSLALSPTSVVAQPQGGSVSFTVLAEDSFGSPIPSLPVSLVVSGADQFFLTSTTDSTGNATFLYRNQNPGTATVKAVSTINNYDTFSNSVSVPWTSPPSTTSGSGGTASLSVSISAVNTIILPNTLSLGGSATDGSLPTGDTISTTWSQVSGPGSVTFANASQISTTASFSEPGSYVLQLSATDVNGSASAQLTIAVNPAPGVTQGWIGNPTYGSQVSCIVPITVATGETLTSGVLSFYPANDPSNVTVLNTNTTGSGQIGTFDTTVLNNGTYWITLQATDSTGSSEYNLDLVTVAGNCKPGRITSTVTDLIVPAKGLAISIQRTYDSLNASTVGDFGYGWNLSTNVNLAVDPKGDVSFTLGGIRHTFYLTPVFNGFLPFYTPSFTPEPGFHGTLSGNGPGCTDLFDFILPDGSLWYCIDGGLYDPTGYVYTDPSGTQYLIGATGNLQSIVDKNGNALTITASGITSSTGLSVPFTRDSSGRITEITDPQGNHYQYSYDSDGNLETVTYPNTSQASTYTYDSNHRYLSGTDFRGNSLPTSAYFGPSDSDPNGLPLNGRLKSVTDALSETTSYAYNLDTNTTTITYPPDANGNVGSATMVYDTSGDLLISTDPLGHTTTNAYDANLNMLSTTDPLSHVAHYTYDSNGNKTSTTYPATATSTNTTSATAYNQYSEPTQTTDEDGSTRTFNYDANFNPQNVTDNSGVLASFAFNTDGTLQSGAVGFDISSQPSMASQFTYDTNGNLVGHTDALGRTTSYTYDSLGHKISMTEPLPNTNTSASAATTNYTYDDFGNLTQTSAPLGRVTSSTYDGNGNKISDTDARGNTTTYQYDALNRLTLTTYPDSTTASKTYDFRGNVITETDQAGHVTKHVYDLAGRQTSVTAAYGTATAATTSYAYDAAGRKLTETDALSHTTTYAYDTAGNLTSVSGVGGSFSYGYDNARNRVSMTDGNGHSTGYLYDARKRLVETDNPDGTKKTNAYDGPGNLISVTDQADNVVEYNYDAANQLKSVVQASSPNSPDNTTIVGYDADGNPIVLQDANLHTTASSFDLANELTAKTMPDGSRTEARSYDEAGNLQSVTHFNGVVTTYTYDTLNRLLSRATPGETTVSFTYTATGKRHTMIDASGTTTYSYDAMDRLTQKATPEGTLTYTYDSAGNLASMASNHTNGVSVSYTYDSLNRLSTVVDNQLSSSNTTTYTYDDASNVGTVTYPNGVETTFTYDQLNRVTGLGSSLGTYSYQLGPTGNRTSASEPSGRSVTWSYDGIYRLTNEAITGAPSGKNGTVSYGLDPVGNRLSDSSSLSGISSGSSTFDSDDRLSTETYDANGNVLTTASKTFTYDSENHLMSMGSTVGLLYDGDGDRVAKTVSGVTTYYLVDDLNPTGYPQAVDELSGSGSVTRQYTYGLQRISQQQAISSTWTPSFYGYDGGGTVRALTNSAGTVTDTYEYDAFGNLLSFTGTTPNVYKYRGEQWDSDLGLYYLRARYYNPVTGRFMSRDPEDGQIWAPKSTHKYPYAGGDPVDAIDPTGHVEVEYALTRAEIASAVVEGAEAAGKALVFAIKTVCFGINYLVTLPSLVAPPHQDPIPPPIAITCLLIQYEPLKLGFLF